MVESFKNYLTCTEYLYLTKNASLSQDKPIFALKQTSFRAPSLKYELIAYPIQQVVVTVDDPSIFGGFTLLAVGML